MARRNFYSSAGLDRAAHHRENTQWLAERLEDYKPRDPHAAYDAHKDWMPAHLRHEI